MRKTWKRALSYVLSAALVLTAGAFGSVQGEKSAKAADTYTAKLSGQMNTDKATVGEWDFSASTDFKLGEEATIKFPAADAASGDAIGCFSGNFIGIDTNLPVDSSLSCKITSVKYDGVEAEGLDYSQAVFGPENEDSTTERITLINKWGGVDNGIFPEDYEFPAFKTLEISFIIGEPAEKLEKPFGVHMASFGTIWDWTGEDYGRPINVATPGAFEVSVDSYGDYTVEGIASKDASSASGALAVLTDLTEVPTDYTLTPKTVTIGEKEYDWSKATPYVDGGFVRMSIWNEWSTEVQANPIGDVEVAAGETVKATFSVVKKGTAPTTSPKPSPSTKPETKTLGTAKGKTFTSGNFKYKVTTAATITGTKKTTGKVTVVGLTKSGKKKTSINVKNSVSKSGASYKVTAVGSKAFKKATKVKKATLGTNIKSIPTSAFEGCKKLATVSAKGATKIGKSAFKNCKALKKITLKKKVSVKKNAFKGCKKTIKVTGGSKKVNKANVKKLKKSGYKKFK